jgi:hypothetical protein
MGPVMAKTIGCGARAAISTKDLSAGENSSLPDR